MRKRSFLENARQTGRIWQPKLWVCLDRKHFENDGFTITCDFPDRIFLKQKSEMTGECCVFKFLRPNVRTEPYGDESLCVLKGKFSFLNNYEGYDCVGKKAQPIKIMDSGYWSSETFKNYF